MFKRVRQLRIPLAAKCELLFGAAVILVIGAALLVPWQRMEDLTEQLNEKAAAMVARHAVGEHVIQHATRASVPGTSHATQPANDAPRATMIDGQSYAQPRLVPLSAGETARNVTRFELSALSRFQKDPKLRFHARLDANTDTYRYAQPLRAQQTCAQCHGGIASPQTVLASAGALVEPAKPDTGDATPARASTSPDAPPSTQPALLGIVSVEIPSQISTRQLVLNRVFLL